MCFDCLPIFCSHNNFIEFKCMEFLTCIYLQTGAHVVVPLIESLYILELQTRIAPICFFQ